MERKIERNAVSKAERSYLVQSYALLLIAQEGFHMLSLPHYLCTEWYMSNIFMFLTFYTLFTYNIKIIETNM